MDEDIFFGNVQFWVRLKPFQKDPTRKCVKRDHFLECGPNKAGKFTCRLVRFFGQDEQ